MFDEEDLMEMTFGFPVEWAEFSKRQRLFIERFPNLEKALAIAFNREGFTASPVNRVVFFSGRLCQEDFMEILLLCANGYGRGAMKVLRGMYERAATAWYLHKNPDKVDDFLDFYWVSQRRLIHAMKDAFGKDALPADKVKNTEEHFEQVKAKYTIPHCKKCGTTRLNYTWTELDFVSMAKSAGAIGELLVLGYTLPTLESHSTIRAIMDSIEGDEKELTFDPGPQREKADQALQTAHNVLIQVLALQQEHFNLSDLEEPLNQCGKDFIAIIKASDASSTLGPGIENPAAS